MIIGSLRVRGVLRGSYSLKDKRRVLKSLKDQVHNKFNVSIAETEDQDELQMAELGVAAVGTDTPFVYSVLSNVEKFVRFFHGFEVTDVETEVF